MFKYILLLVLILTACATDRQSIGNLSCIEAHLYYLGSYGIDMSPQAVEAIAKNCRDHLQ